MMTTHLHLPPPRGRSRIVNKKLDAEEILNAVRAAEEGGLDKLKLYGMARATPLRAASPYTSTPPLLPSFIARRCLSPVAGGC